MMENIERKEDYIQVCIWPGCVVKPEGTEEEFEKFMLEEFSVRVQYLEEVKTAPDFKNGHPVGGTGDRNDLLFAVHKDDVGKFAVKRLLVGIRWIEDVLALYNNCTQLYPERLGGYRSWNATL